MAGRNPRSILCVLLYYDFHDPRCTDFLLVMRCWSWLKIYWLVVWNIFYFSIYWEFHHPNWQTHIFQRGRYTTNQYRSVISVSRVKTARAVVACCSVVHKTPHGWDRWWCVNDWGQGVARWGANVLMPNIRPTHSWCYTLICLNWLPNSFWCNVFFLLKQLPTRSWCCAPIFPK